MNRIQVSAIALLTLIVTTATTVAQDSLSGVWLASSGDVLVLTENETASGGLLIGQSMGFVGVDGTVKNGQFSFKSPGVAIEGERQGAWMQGRFTRAADENGEAVDFDFSAYRPVELSSSLLDGVWCLEDDVTGRQSYCVAFTIKVLGLQRTRIIEVHIDAQGRPIGSDVFRGQVFGSSGLFLAYSSRAVLAGQVSNGLVYGVKASGDGEESSFIGSRKEF